MSPVSHPWIKSYPPGLRWDIEIASKPAFSMLDETVSRFGNRPAFDFLGKKYTWSDIGVQVDAFAAGLQSLGVGKGSRIGLFLPNTPYYLIAYYAALKTGATLVNFNPLYPERELQHQINDSGTEIMVTLDLAMMYDKMETMLAQTALKKVILCHFTDILPFPKNILFPLAKKKDMAKIKPSDRILWFHDLTHTHTKLKIPAIDPLNDVALLQYTGGTTGTPKGAMLTHENIYANTLQSVTWFKNVEFGQQRMMGVLPFFHVFAMTAVMNFSVMAGLEIIALPRFDLMDTLKAIHKRKPHFFPAVPAIYNAINNCSELGKFDLSSLKYCISGGAPLPVEVKKSFEKITGCIVIEGYGLSESSPVACANPIEGENVAGSIGLPVPATIIEIVSLEDRETPMPFGERGELCIRGPQVMKGYWNKPQDSADVLKDGRLYTGDVAVMDERGYVYIVDRIKDMIITNGYKVYPRNVEEAIYLHPAVQECVVAGLHDDQRGEIVKAWIKLKEGQTLDADDLKHFLADKISKMEIPKRIEFRDELLPKTMIGKLSRKDLLAEEKA
jgi:long-chain acyl-CoA synthetase